MERRTSRRAPERYCRRAERWEAMRRSLLAGAVCLATATGIVGAAGSLGEGILRVGAILVVATFGSVAIHALLDPPSYGRPPFTGVFYRVWATLVALGAAVALVAKIGRAPGREGHVVAVAEECREAGEL